jgi:hypothetical protein
MTRCPDSGLGQRRHAIGGLFPPIGCVVVCTALRLGRRLRLLDHHLTDPSLGAQTDDAIVRGARPWRA